MEKDTKSQLANGFLWTSSILGFIVDTVALISIWGNINTPSVSIANPNIHPAVNLGNLTLNWSDITLIIIIYVGIIFLGISVRYDPSDAEGFISLFLFHFFLGLVGLWALVFVFSGEFIFIPRLVGIWLTGFFSLLWVKSKGEKDKKVTLWQFFSIPFVILVLVLPIWALFEKGFKNQNWETAIFNTFIWGLLGILAVYLIWIIFVLIYLGLRKILYSKPEGTS